MIARQPVAGRKDVLHRHGFAYGDLGLALAFTEGLEGDAAKRVRAKGWDTTRPLPDGAFGAALLAGRGTVRNPAVVLRPSNLIGIDVDGREGLQHLHRVVPDGLPLTITVETGNGYHLWFRPPPGHTRTAFIQLGPDGVQAKKNQYMVCPPAIHETGRVYAFAPGRAPWDVLPAVIPGSTVERLERAARVARETRAAADGPITTGGRHDYLMRLGCAMRRRGAGEHTIAAALLVENRDRCSPPKDEALVLALAADIAHRYPAGAA